MAFGTGTKALTTTAAQLHAGQPCSELVIQNNDASIAMLIGTASAQNRTIPAGGNSGPIRVRNLNQVYIKSASGTPTASYHYT